MCGGTRTDVDLSTFWAHLTKKQNGPRTEPWEMPCVWGFMFIHRYGAESAWETERNLSKQWEPFQRKKRRRIFPISVEERKNKRWNERCAKIWLKEMYLGVLWNAVLDRAVSVSEFPSWFIMSCCERSAELPWMEIQFPYTTFQKMAYNLCNVWTFIFSRFHSLSLMSCPNLSSPVFVLHPVCVIFE